MARGYRSLPALPLKCENSAVFELESQPQYKVPNPFATPNPLELAVKMFRGALWIALIVFLQVLFLLLLKNILQRWPDKYLHE